MDNQTFQRFQVLQLIMSTRFIIVRTIFDWKNQAIPDLKFASSIMNGELDSNTT